MASPFPFTSGQVLTAAQLNSIAEWTTFTPSLTNVSLGASGTAVGRYAEINDLVLYTASFDLGGTGSVTGNVILDTPVGTADNSTTYATSHMGWLRPTGGSFYMAMAYSSGASIQWYAYTTSASYSTNAPANATTPVTWTSSGSAFFTGWYAKT